MNDRFAMVGQFLPQKRPNRYVKLSDAVGQKPTHLVRAQLTIPTQFRLGGVV